MKGLLIKDYFTSKPLLKNYLLILLIYAFVAYANDNVFMFSGLMTMIPLLMVINSVAYDEKAHAEKWLIASGTARKHLALSKYLFALILTGITFVLNVEIVLMIHDLRTALVTSVLFGFVGMAYTSFLLPLLFHYGTEKARLFMIVGFLIPLALGSSVSSMIEMLGISLNEIVIVSLILASCLTVIMISMALSIRIVEKKDY